MEASSLSLFTERGLNFIGSPFGRIVLSNDELLLYKSIFEIFDVDDDGRLEKKDITILFNRTNLPKRIITEIWQKFSGGSGAVIETIDLTLEQWLISCKLISIAQSMGHILTNLLFDTSLNASLPFATFGLHNVDIIDYPDTQLESVPVEGKEKIDIDIIGWDVIGEGLQKYTAYKLRYTTVNVHTLPRQEYEVSRRFSDFRVLYSQLLRYKGFIIPFLPLASWAQQLQSMTDEGFSAQRSHELVSFLSYLTQNPRLRHAIELKVSCGA